MLDHLVLADDHLAQFLADCGMGLLQTVQGREIVRGGLAGGGRSGIGHRRFLDGGNEARNSTMDRRLDAVAGRIVS